MERILPQSNNKPRSIWIERAWKSVGKFIHIFTLEAAQPREKEESEE
jgi:hypothetical protein